LDRKRVEAVIENRRQKVSIQSIPPKTRHRENKANEKKSELVVVYVYMASALEDIYAVLKN